MSKTIFAKVHIAPEYQVVYIIHLGWFELFKNLNKLLGLICTSTMEQNFGIFYFTLMHNKMHK